MRAPSLLSYEGRRRCLKLSKEGVPCPAVLLRDFNPVISRKFSRLKFLDFFHINYSGHVIKSLNEKVEPVIPNLTLRAFRHWYQGAWSGWLKDSAPSNINLISVTLDTFQLLSG